MSRPSVVEIRVERRSSIASRSRPPLLPDSSADSLTDDEHLDTASSHSQVASETSPTSNDQDPEEDSSRGSFDDDVEPDDSASRPPGPGKQVSTHIPRAPPRESRHRVSVPEPLREPLPGRRPSESRAPPDPHQSMRTHRGSRARPGSYYGPSDGSSVSSYEEYLPQGYPGAQPRYRYVQGPPPQQHAAAPHPYHTYPTQMSPPPPGQLVHVPHDPFGYQNPISPAYSHQSPFSPSHAPHAYQTPGYFPPQPPQLPQQAMAMMQYPPPYYYPPSLPPQSRAPSDDHDSYIVEERFAKLQHLIEAQETARVAKDSAREALVEAEKKAAIAKAVEEEAAKQVAQKHAKDIQKAKEQIEEEAKQAAKLAAEAHEKAMKEAKEATEKAQKAEKEAKEEAKKLKPPSDDGKHIKFKDAVGRKFSFPWKICKTWKGMEELICQAFLHVEGIGKHVKAGHFDLVGPDGEIILPQVWEITVQPDWNIVMHMWPMTEEQPKPAAMPLPMDHPMSGSTSQRDGGKRSSRLFGGFGGGSQKDKERKSRNRNSMVQVPMAPPPIPGQAAQVIADPHVANTSGGPPIETITGSEKGGKKKARQAPRGMLWAAGGVYRKR